MAPAKKLSDRGRRSGGLLCLVKKDVNPYFTYVESFCDNTLIFRISKELVGSEKDVLAIFAYLPPVGSPYYNTVEETDGIQMLQRCMNNVTDAHDNCDILLCGDLNARTSNLNTSCNDVFDMRSDVLQNSRSSQDTATNEYGLSLLSLCAAFTLTILNGFLSQSESGVYTYVSSNGSSVIDYCISSRDLLPAYRSLRIENSVVSPHMCLELTFNSSDSVSMGGNYTSSSCNSTRVVWDMDSIPQYIRNLRSEISDSEIEEIMSREAFDVNRATETITSCFVQAADFLTRTIRSGRECNRGKEWYDREYYATKKEAYRKLRHYLHFHSEVNRLAYTTCRNEYKQLIRTKNEEYRQKTSVKLTNSVRDARSFWKEIRKLNFRSTVSTCVSLDTWYVHFRDLFSSSNYATNTSEASFQCSDSSDESLLITLQ
ncbi:MAG: hypothetical protein DSZ28_04135 [Thiothrix sp.]|nr:MAG: hypothetical protein DSZ28_04135 [Thiothrix sp.]